eukprot:gene8211-biopygen19619
MPPAGNQFPFGRRGSGGQTLWLQGGSARDGVPGRNAGGNDTARVRPRPVRVRPAPTFVSPCVGGWLVLRRRLVFLFVAGVTKCVRHEGEEQ